MALQAAGQCVNIMFECMLFADLLKNVAESIHLVSYHSHKILNISCLCMPHHKGPKLQKNGLLKNTIPALQCQGSLQG